MIHNKKIRVLIVDDSLLFRQVMARGMTTDPEIEVIGEASDPIEAVEMLTRLEPDVVTCDIEMPRMNGIDFVRQLLQRYPVPVIMVSSVSDAVFDALQVGAVDFVVKPQANIQRIEEFIQELIAKVHIASRVDNTKRSAHLATGNPAVRRSGTLYTDKLIAIGASTGGTEAIYQVLKELPPDLPGIVIVQHIPPVFSRMFAERLQQRTAWKVREARSGDRIESGQVLIAPGDRHMKLRKQGSLLSVECLEDERVNGHCPSVDVLFHSVAERVGRDALGVLLTGMGQDGAQGLLAMRRQGARTIGQDESSSVVYGMPQAAWSIGAVERQAALADIPALLMAMLR